MSKTLENLHKALAKVDGHKESVAVVYCDNKSYQSAYVGDWRLTGQSIASLMGKVVEQKMLPSEFALVQAILHGIAAVDKRYKGQVIELIREIETYMDENGNVMPNEKRN